MARRRAAALALAAAACAPGIGCGGSTPTPSASVSTTRPQQSPAAHLEAADATLQRSLRRWRAADPTLQTPPPKEAIAAAADERQVVHDLAGNRRLARAIIAALPPALATRIRADVLAARDLRRLRGPPSGVPLRLVPPRPAGELLAEYRLAQRRFGVRWEVLAALNLVESAFGRVVNRSSAGARGPMQFLPSTWRAYGLGGDVNDPHDAILGAANYLHRSGAPGDDRTALYAYNPSRLYVESVLIYARAMERDPLAFLAYYAREAGLEA
jgi:soluble lytic murein transglycosylase-like protein